MHLPNEEDRADKLPAGSESFWKLNKVTLDSSRSVRLARTASVSCCVSPWNKSAVEFEACALTLSTAGAMVDSFAAIKMD